MRSKPILSRVLVTWALLLVATSSHALTIRCVGTSQQLADAITEANLSSDPIFIIRVREGTYVNDREQEFRLLPTGSNRTLLLNGGWSGDNGNCQTQRSDPSLTRLVGTSERSALNFGLSIAGGRVNNQVGIVDFHLTNPFFTRAARGACLQGYVDTSHHSLIERIQTFQCYAPHGESASISLVTTGGDLTMRNVSVRAGVAINNGGIRVQAQDGGAAYLSQISVTQTHSSEASDWLGSGLALITIGNSAIHVGNSVSWGNDPDSDTADIWTNGNGVLLTRVHYGRLFGTPSANIAASTGDPGFTAPGDARLRPDSILVDSGNSSPQAGTGSLDADGAARVQGMAIDVGAFELKPVPTSDVIFGNGFQSPP